MISSEPRRPQVVVVTGAAAGLGRTIAHAFADRGDRVASLARNRTALEAAAKEGRARDGGPLAVEVGSGRRAAPWHPVSRWTPGPHNWPSKPRGLPR